MRFSKMYIFGAPIESVRGAWYGIFLICEKPALRAGLINDRERWKFNYSQNPTIILIQVMILIQVLMKFSQLNILVTPALIQLKCSWNHPHSDLSLRIRV